MPKKTRRILFWLIVGLFIIASGFLLVYSFGYRINWQTLEIRQTGGLYLKTSPKVTDIFLDTKKIDQKGGLLSSGIFVQNLFPRSYQLEISKDGYFSWTKQVKIAPTLVDNFTHIILLSRSPLKESIYSATSTEEITDFLPLGNQKETILELRLKNKLGWFGVLEIFDKGNATTTEIFRKKINRDEKPDLLTGLVADGADANQIIFSNYDRASSQTIFYLWSRLTPEEPINLTQIVAKYNLTKVKKIAFHPFEDNKFIVETAKKIAILDLNKNEASYLSAENPLDFAVSGGNLFWIDKDGGIYSYNFILKSTSPWTIIEDEKLQVKDWLVSANSDNIAVLLAAGKLILVQAGQPPKILSNAAQSFVFSFDNKKLAYSDKSGQIKIYFLEDLTQDITKKAGDEVVLADASDNLVSQLIWHKDSCHLIATIGEEIVFSEIDDRDRLNVFKYQFGPGHYFLGSDGVIFRATASFLEKINLAISE